MKESETAKQLRAIKLLIVCIANFFLARQIAQSEQWWQAMAYVGVVLILTIICVATE